MSQNKEQKITKKVMKKIQRGEVKMKPRFYFVAGSILLGIGTAGMVVLAVFFTHLLFFRFRIFTPFAFLRLGHMGWRPFILHFPWWPLFLSFFGLWGGFKLLRRFDFTYQKGLWLIALSLLTLVAIFGFLFDRLNPEEPLGRLRPLKPFYELQMKDQKMVVGQVKQVKELFWLVMTPEGEEIKVFFDKQARFPLGRDIGEGNYVRIVGDWQENGFIARGIITNGRGFNPRLLQKRRPANLR